MTDTTLNGIGEIKAYFLEEFESDWFISVQARLARIGRELAEKNVSHHKLPDNNSYALYFRNTRFDVVGWKNIDPEYIDVHKELLDEFNQYIDLMEQHEIDMAKCTTLVRKILNASTCLEDIMLFSPDNLKAFFLTKIKGFSQTPSELTADQISAFKQENEEALNFLKEYELKTKLFYF